MKFLSFESDKNKKCPVILNDNNDLIINYQSELGWSCWGEIKKETLDRVSYSGLKFLTFLQPYYLLKFFNKNPDLLDYAYSRFLALLSNKLIPSEGSTDKFHSLQYCYNHMVIVSYNCRVTIPYRELEFIKDITDLGNYRATYEKNQHARGEFLF